MVILQGRVVATAWILRLRQIFVHRLVLVLLGLVLGADELFVSKEIHWYPLVAKQVLSLLARKKRKIDDGLQQVDPVCTVLILGLKIGFWCSPSKQPTL